MVISRSSMRSQVEKPGMRKKIAMRKGGKVTKYADGGRVHGGQRPQEDRARMAAEAAAQFDAEEEAYFRRQASANRPRPSLISNNPVGMNRVAGRTPVGSPTPPRPRMSDAGGQPAIPRLGRVGPGEDTPEATAQNDSMRPRTRVAASRGRGTQRAARVSEADRLNDISLAFARGERPRGGAADTIGKALGIEGYKKGGKVAAKKGKKK